MNRIDIDVRPNGKCLLIGQIAGEEPSFCQNVLISCYQLEDGKYCPVAEKKASQIIAGMVETERYIGD